MADTEVALRQRYGWFKRLDLAIEDDDLLLRYRIWRNEYPRRIPLVDIDIHTCEGLVRPSWWYYGALIFAGMAVGLAAMAALETYVVGSASVVWWGAGLLMAGVAVVFFFIYLMSSAECIWFYSISEGTLLFMLHARRPSREAVNAFAECLLREAATRRERMRSQETVARGAYKAACEIEKSHTLLQAGVLDREAYETKKRALLRCFLSGAMEPAANDQAIAQIVQRRGLAGRYTLTLYPDRMERLEVTPLTHYRGFAYLGAFPEQPDKRALPPYRLAAALSFVILVIEFFMVALVLAGAPQTSVTDERLLVVLGILGGILLLPFVVVWFMRRRSHYIFGCNPYVSPVSGSVQTTQAWRVREGQPTRAAVEAFLKAYTRAHRDYHDDYRTPREIFDKFESLYEREILTEDEIQDIHARLSRRPPSRGTRGGWGIAPSLN